MSLAVTSSRLANVNEDELLSHVGYIEKSNQMTSRYPLAPPRFRAAALLRLGVGHASLCGRLGGGALGVDALALLHVHELVLVLDEGAAVAARSGEDVLAGAALDAEPAADLGALRRGHDAGVDAAGDVADEVVGEALQVGYVSLG